MVIMSVWVAVKTLTARSSARVLLATACPATNAPATVHNVNKQLLAFCWIQGPDLGGPQGPRGPEPQASHQQGVSHQTPQFLKPCNSIANPFLKSQIRHQGPQASHQLNPALLDTVEIKTSSITLQHGSADTVVRAISVKYRKWRLGACNSKPLNRFS